MSLLNFTTGVKKLQQALGLNDWALSTCSYTIADITGSTQTITFLDLGGTLSKFGINLELSASPIAQTLANAINNPSSLPFLGNSSDTSGNTYLTKSVDVYKNNIVTYNRINSTPVMQHWGADVTRFSVFTMFEGHGHLEKLKALHAIFSKNLGEAGGTLQHHLWGIIPGVFVEEYSVQAAPSPFNGVIIEVKFVTGNNQVQAQTPSTLSEVNKFVNNALNAISIVGTIPTIGSQLRKLYPNALFGNSLFGTSSGEFVQIQGVSTTVVKGTTTNLRQTNPSLALAVQQLSASSISLDFDVVVESQKIIEKSCQNLNITVLGYGSGALAKTFTETVKTLNPDALKNSTTIDVNGVETKIQYQPTTKNADGTYNVTKTITVATPIQAPLNPFEMRVSVNQLVKVGGVMCRLYPELYPYYTSLISSLESLVIEAFNTSETFEYTLTEDSTPTRIASKFGMPLDAFFKLNSSWIINHRKILKGMKVTVRRQ